jgi:hypothetical protein
MRERDLITEGKNLFHLEMIDEVDAFCRSHGIR